MNQADLAKFLQAARRRAGLTQDDIAELLKVTQAAVSAWETGKNEPGIETISKWAVACGGDIALSIVRGQTPDTSRLIELWAEIPDWKRATLLAMVEAAAKTA